MKNKKDYSVKCEADGKPILPDNPDNMQQLIYRMKMRNYIIDKQFEAEKAIVDKLNKNDPTGDSARGYLRAKYLCLNQEI